MARARRKAAPRTGSGSTTTNQDTLPGTGGDTSDPKKKKRRSDDEIEAALLEKLEAVRTRKSLSAVATNKPLVAAIKAVKRLKQWLSEETYAAVASEIQEWIDGKDGAFVDDSDDSDDSDDGDAS